MNKSSPITHKELLSRILKAKNSDKNSTTIACGNSLYLRVFKTGKTFWYVRLTNKFIKIGEFPKNSLAQIREVSRKYLPESVQDTEVEKTNKGTNSQKTFGEVAEEWLESKKNRVRFTNIKRYVHFLTPLFPYTFHEITNVFVKQELSKQEITPYQLREVLRTLCRIADLAIEDEIIEFHNFEVLKKSESFPKYHRSQRGYNFVPIEKFNDLFSRILILPEKLQLFYLLLALICLRPGECRQLKWKYFNFDEKILYVPGKIMKVKKEEPFRVPMSKQVESIVKYLNDHTDYRSEYLFCRKTSLSSPISEGDIAIPLKNVAGDLTHAHGFRKSSRSFFAENEVPIEVAAKCFDHTLPTGADIYYQKSDLVDLRRVAMQSLADAIEKKLPKEFLKFLKYK